MFMIPVMSEKIADILVLEWVENFNVESSERDRAVRGSGYGVQSMVNEDWRQQLQLIASILDRVELESWVESPLWVSIDVWRLPAPTLTSLFQPRVHHCRRILLDHPHKILLKIYIYIYTYQYTKILWHLGDSRPNYRHL